MLAGGTVGLNMQASDFVFGVEADGDWTNLVGNGSSAGYNCTAGVTCQTKSPFFGTLRARLGWECIRAKLVRNAGWCSTSCDTPTTTCSSSTN